MVKHGFSASVALLALVLAACAPTQEPDARAIAAALPECSAEAISLAEPMGEAACKLMLDGGEFLAVYFAAPASPDDPESGSMRADLWTEAGVTEGVITESGMSGYGAPSVSDFDDLVPGEILVPRAQGNVNTVHAIWRRAPDEPRFVRLGEVSSFQFIGGEDGLIAAPSRSSASTGEVLFFRLGETAIEPIATVETTYSEEGQGTCRLLSAPGAAALGLDEAGAEARFCADGRIWGVD